VLQTGNILAGLGLAALVGGMLFFGAVMAPLVFTKLPPEIAGPFIRSAFPRYYVFIIVSAALGACGCLLRGQTVSAAALVLIVLLTFWLWFWLIPHLETLRLANNTAGFNRGHQLSVWLNGIELVTAMVLLGRFSLRH
jgi:hypothetical protein